MTAGTWTPADATGAFTTVRALRRTVARQRRRAIPITDRLYPYYSALVVVTYLAIFLTGTGDVRIGGRRIDETAAGHAAIGVLGSLLVLAVVAVVGLVAAGAVDGGPVAIPVEDLRVLLPMPVPRSVLLRRALLRAYVRALAAGLAAAGLLLLAEVALLSQRFADCGLAAIALPLLVAVAVVSLGWLVESHPVGRYAGRVLAAVCAVAVGLAGVAVALRVGAGGQLAGWARTGQVVRDAGLGSLARGLQPGGGAGPVVVAVAVVTALLTGAAWARTRAVSAERIGLRSGRARALRTALLLGLTSSAYVTRTAAVRRRRRLRWTPPGLRTPRGALLVKAFLQEQGTALAVRGLLTVAVLTVLLAGLHSRQVVSTHTPGVVGGAAAGLALAALATRYADPLRVDVELTTPVGSLPLPFTAVATADLLLPALSFALAAVVAAVLVPVLGLAPAATLPGLLVLGLLLAPAATAIGALSATANSPSPTLSPGAQVAFRLRGVLAALVVLTLVGLLLHPVARAGAAHGSTRPTAYAVLALADAVLVVFAVVTGSKALLRAR